MTYTHIIAPHHLLAVLLQVLLLKFNFSHHNFIPHDDNNRLHVYDVMRVFVSVSKRNNNVRLYVNDMKSIQLGVIIDVKYFRFSFLRILISLFPNITATTASFALCSFTSLLCNIWKSLYLLCLWRVACLVADVSAIPQILHQFIQKSSALLSRYAS